MTNKFNGEVDIMIAGERHIVVFDWNAIGKLNSMFTPQELDSVANGVNTENLLDFLVIGLQKHHPEITKKHLEQNNPPYVPTMEAIGRAMNYGYFGTDTEEEAPAKKKPTKAPNARKKAQAKKKNPN